MSDFKVNDKVQIKQPAYFAFGSIQRAFEQAKGRGTVDHFTDGTIAVKADGSAEWDYFVEGELTKVEETEA